MTWCARRRPRLRNWKAEIEELTVGEFKAELEAGVCTAIDIRDFRERLSVGAVSGAVSIPRGMLEFWFDPESPYYREGYEFNKRYVFYCASGWRSALAAKVVGELGYTNVAHLESGFTGWTDAGEPVEDVAASSKWVKQR
jgi:rhodanese-related sulfurtransferase